MVHQLLKLQARLNGLIY